MMAGPVFGLLIIRPWDYLRVIGIAGADFNPDAIIAM
jgi:hypothetical protein